MLSHIEEWTGYGREELAAYEEEHNGLVYGIRYEVLEECAMALEDMIDAIGHGVDPNLDEVITKPRRDGASGKVRDVAYLCIRHQLLGHAVKLGLEPLLSARIMPTQHASIQGRGQTGLKRQVQRFLNRKLGIRFAQKTDCTGAYASVQYAAVIETIQQEIPRARWILDCLRMLKNAAPGGHLIIGGYLDAWLFNYVMSYALRYTLGLYRSRRGNRYPLVIRIITFMDDALFLAHSITGMRQAIREMKGFLWERYRMQLRVTTDVLKTGDVIDMGGYRIRSRDTTIRRRNWRRIRRCMIRAWREYRRTGTIKRQRACQIISRNGMIANSDSRNAAIKYHVYPLMRVSRKVQAYWSRQTARDRREIRKHVVHRYYQQRAALCGAG